MSHTRANIKAFDSMESVQIDAFYNLYIQLVGSSILILPYHAKDPKNQIPPTIKQRIKTKAIDSGATLLSLLHVLLVLRLLLSRLDAALLLRFRALSLAPAARSLHHLQAQH